MRILLVEDDISLGEGIRTALRRAAYTVDWLRDGASALAAIKDGGIDLAVLDLGLPHMDGLEVIRQTRRSGAELPILVLSARERASDRALGLDAGADDYLGKPFDTQELLARVRALLRRSGGRAVPVLELGELALDPASLSVTWRGKQLDLPRREFALLRLLMEQRGRPISRDSAQQRLYGWDEDVASNAIDVHIHALRKKLDPALIRTLRGIGYALDERIARPAGGGDVA
ncbi:response regulator transcription factor [Pseudoxanthomonas wuyuanensis]|uniref:Two-component system, OmpR family, response regulator/two-component system, OmpR family, response regulator QseB n=1 Tax=Pseudoxanthomonas wuyuanensis TaxID=1073196 RepID=A0A286D6C1_9GAMM|nr:response regulator transcription factor [Pseudoxanthomonas wuyuanensis]KAF1721515.1 DNA-binding response regulator [Pseudoxanthomonas wuyuanensis]SOD54205.1 two-component system, OmpR family, response regulator/two-component system, OmpR family, response regulator QseB [Pseudoxanthomonas wuyuanensis]